MIAIPKHAAFCRSRKRDIKQINLEAFPMVLGLWDPIPVYGSSLFNVDCECGSNSRVSESIPMRADDPIIGLCNGLLLALHKHS